MDDRTHRFRAIYDDTYEDLWRYCLRRCSTSTHAEDVLGETFATAWRRFDDVPAPPEARPYLFGIARNLIRDDRRRSDRDHRLTERLQNATRTRRTAHGAGATGSAGDDLAVVIQALHQLSDADQEILRLATWEQVPHVEIAAVLKCSVNAVGIRLHRARNRLAERTQQLDPTTPIARDLQAASPCLTSERKPS